MTGILKYLINPKKKRHKLITLKFHLKPRLEFVQIDLDWPFRENHQVWSNPEPVKSNQNILLRWFICKSNIEIN